MEYIFYWEWKILKNGKRGNTQHYVATPYTKINYCDLCGKFGPPRKVNYRNDAYRWNVTGQRDLTTENKDMLCMGCWNKIRPIVKRANDAIELRNFINQITKELRNEQKQNHQNNGRTSGLSCRHDGRR